MRSLSTLISSFLGLVMIAVTLLPSLHAMAHNKGEEASQVTSVISKDGFDCNLCDFHLSSLNTPTFEDYSIFIPVKESIYSLSLTQTIHLFPDTLFSLRAPPAKIA